jgi:hypothetical protein
MHALDVADDRARFNGAAYTMELARARFKADANPNRLGFRAWARRTYSPAAVAGKLSRVVGRRAS